jgi:hypothetical protein
MIPDKRPIVAARRSGDKARATRGEYSESQCDPFSQWSIPHHLLVRLRAQISAREYAPDAGKLSKRIVESSLLA